MAAPNILSATSIYGKTVGCELNTTITQGILTCASNKVLKIVSIIAANIDGASGADVTVVFQDDSKTGNLGVNTIANTVNVPADASIIIVGKDAPIYLEESDEIRAGASANGDIMLTVAYEELDDA
tara:strand:- start:837 stop:1214 length:378 start_codon:yes stop_codon:yes gene_type:complete